MEHKIIENEFKWVPLDKRQSRFGGPSLYRKPEKRYPLLWLARKGGELYLVNSSKDSLDFVISSSGGFATEDDDVLTFKGHKYEYKNVKPNDAVKVEEFDGFYDLDLVLQVDLKIQSKSIGCITIQSPPEKGGVGEIVLLWDTFENGKNVIINR